MVELLMEMRWKNCFVKTCYCAGYLALRRAFRTSLLLDTPCVLAYAPAAHTARWRLAIGCADTPPPFYLSSIILKYLFDDIVPNSFL
jgi:hypothetical protein